MGLSLPRGNCGNSSVLRSLPQWVLCGGPSRPGLMSGARRCLFCDRRVICLTLAPSRPTASPAQALSLPRGSCRPWAPLRLSPLPRSWPLNLFPLCSRGCLQPPVGAVCLPGPGPGLTPALCPPCRAWPHRGPVQGQGNECSAEHEPTWVLFSRGPSRALVHPCQEFLSV